MRVTLCALLWLVLSSVALGQDHPPVHQQALEPADLHSDLNDELRKEQADAAQRQQRELTARAAALSEQTKTAQELLQRQQQYIEQLEAQIRALQDTSDSDD